MGKDRGGEDLGPRIKITIQEIRRTMLERIRSSFIVLGWDAKAKSLTQERIDGLKISDAELIGLRMYTGPAFVAYNAVLRAMGNGVLPGVVPSYDPNFGGMNVRGRLTTTLHAINNGVIKTSKLSQKITVYRGFSGRYGCLNTKRAQ